MVASAGKQIEEKQAGENGYSMDDIWNDIALSDENNIKPVYNYSEQASNFTCPPLASPSWDWLWKMEEEESKTLLPNPMADQFFTCYEYGRDSLTG